MFVPVIREKEMIVNKNQVKKTPTAQSFSKSNIQVVPSQEGRDLLPYFHMSGLLRGFGGTATAFPMHKNCWWIST